ncbi:MAG TPA: phage tail protein [Blastocatellia bacterium]|nr:phage tail protein [Blastocatellia bacterium]
MARDIPYPAFNFLVKIDGVITNEQDIALGGFSDVSGINTEITVAEYRNGNEVTNHVRKVPGIYKVGDVTLKRGIINSTSFWDWIKETRRSGHKMKRDVTITLRDESGADVMTWSLRKTIPLKYTGPTMAAKGGGDVAMEELVLSAEDLDFAQIQA